MITKEQLQLCEILLQKRQHKLIHKNKNFGLENSEKDSVGELSSYDNHPAEMATELYEREKDVTLHARREKELEQINAALHAIEEGTYGVCSVCGKAISFERLLIVPMTEYCSEHAEHGDDTNQQSASEDVIKPNITRESEDIKEEVGYDAEDAWQEVSKYGTSETPSDFYGDHDNYDEMYPNSDELRGSVESVENIPEQE
ncbi:MAG TPA: TraR/DksA C4-type zinc finger protein [Bacillota bacterium]|nr:TraR/DksA C4-type zinc finger protein [Bacillota bacterium]